MAKKVVATLKKKDGVKYAKVIKAIKTKTGAYSFREEIVTEDRVKEVLAAK
ncbi:MAG: DUF4295 family protein [Reichenbachiella sp.]|uniref:DUF4295 family protein n=1 Tax=Reichenbachiella sp. TaxID=2184521 RepID=UPI003267F9C6